MTMAEKIVFNWQGQVKSYLIRWCNRNIHPQVLFYMYTGMFNKISLQFKKTEFNRKVEKSLSIKSSTLQRIVYYFCDMSKPVD